MTNKTYTPPVHEPQAFSTDRDRAGGHGQIHRVDHAAEILREIEDARDKLHREFTSRGAGDRRPNVAIVKITDDDFQRAHAAGARRQAAASLPPARTRDGRAFGRRRTASRRPA